MKQLFIILIVFCTFQTKAQQWSEVISGTNTRLLSISFANENTGYIGGSNGLMLKTTNGGQSWDSVYIAEIFQDFYPDDIVDIHFLNPATGYIVTSSFENPVYSGALYKTSDSGNTWTIMDVGNTAVFRSFFNDVDNGFVVGSAFFAGYVINKIPSGDPSEYHFYSFMPQQFFRCVDFYNSQIGIVAGDSGLIARTIDGGQNWDTLFCQVTDTSIYAIRFLNAHTILAACDDQGGTLLISTDTGKTWSVDFNSVTFDYPVMKSIVSSSVDSFIAVGASTTFAGKGEIYWHDSLSSRFERVNQPLHAVAMQNNLTAYAVGDSGLIVKKSNSNNVGVQMPGSAEKTFHLFPNPAKDYFFSQSEIAHDIQVYDMSGRLVYKTEEKRKQHIVSMKTKAAGIYSVVISTESGQLCKQIVIE